MTEDDPRIIKSPLSRKFTRDDITIDVEIYKLETSEGWSLELVDEDWNSTVWAELFPTDQAAFDTFLLGVEQIGLPKLLLADARDPTVH